mgnify:CR=1 FL=1
MATILTKDEFVRDVSGLVVKYFGSIENFARAYNDMLDQDRRQQEEDYEMYDKQHGSFFDRGSADSYYGRPRDPHHPRDHPLRAERRPPLRLPPGPAPPSDDPRRSRRPGGTPSSRHPLAPSPPVDGLAHRRCGPRPLRPRAPLDPRGEPPRAAVAADGARDLRARDGDRLLRPATGDPKRPRARGAPRGGRRRPGATRPLRLVWDGRPDRHDRDPDEREAGALVSALRSRSARRRAPRPATR